MEVAHLILAAATDTLNSSFPSPASPEGEWGDWRGEGDRAIMVAVKEALSGAAGSVHDQMGEELVIAVARGVVEMRLASSAVETLEMSPIFLVGMVHTRNPIPKLNCRNGVRIVYGVLPPPWQISHSLYMFCF